MKKSDKLEVISPIYLEQDWQPKEVIINNIIDQYKNYGFTSFCLSSPSLVHIGGDYPTREQLEYGAQLFNDVKNGLKEYNLKIGWWFATVLRNGHADGFTRVMDYDGKENPFANCPTNETFTERLSDDVAYFAKLTHPAFIITEDDFCLNCNAWRYGCFCDLHMKAFEEVTGVHYTREELVKKFDEKTPESFELLKEWRKLQKKTVIHLADRIREKLDIDTPEIPMGTMQSGCSDLDWDLTEDLARALAGKNHTPFSRLFGTFYCGGASEDVPEHLFHSLYSREHINGDFLYLHESDTYPMYRFFNSKGLAKTVLSTAYSYGYDGSIYNNIPVIDHPTEERAYASVFAKERDRFNALYAKVRQCKLDGVGILYDTFWNTADPDRRTIVPLWVKVLGNMGIPYTTRESKVTFMDRVHAEHLEDAEIKKYLSKGLFLDGEAAKYLSDRGYGKYIGVEIGDDVAVGKYQFDLGAREVIRDEFLYGHEGKNMVSAHAYADFKNGKLLKMTVIDDKCEIISEECDGYQNVVSPAMTRFENCLGGRIVVMGQTLENNYCHSLYNYRRQRLFHELIKWCGGEYVIARDIARLFTVVNKPVDEEKSGFKGIVTVNNISDDKLFEIILELSGDWNNAKEYFIMDENGNWEKADYTKEDNILKINTTLENMSSLFIMLK